ncbi:MAG: hypothetical protein EZS28_007789 [Streblomastix strix]|uniref:Uncharacterized protein n=1 Tax=Streblomastix strix TaxID=222440 RepID=A0A5J4WPZ3_9EUKA|nr:MAG: hypothetical protein EZS28_007789 [Streblomastix strix]
MQVFHSDVILLFVVGQYNRIKPIARYATFAIVSTPLFNVIYVLKCFFIVSTKLGMLAIGRANTVGTYLYLYVVQFNYQQICQYFFDHVRIKLNRNEEYPYEPFLVQLREDETSSKNYCYSSSRETFIETILEK